MSEIRGNAYFKTPRRKRTLQLPKHSPLRSSFFFFSFLFFQTIPDKCWVRFPISDFSIRSLSESKQTPLQKNSDLGQNYRIVWTFCQRILQEFQLGSSLISPGIDFPNIFVYLQSPMYWFGGNLWVFLQLMWSLWLDLVKVGVFLLHPLPVFRKDSILLLFFWWKFGDFSFFLAVSFCQKLVEILIL